MIMFVNDDLYVLLMAIKPPYPYLSVAEIENTLKYYRRACLSSLKKDTHNESVFRIIRDR